MDAVRALIRDVPDFPKKGIVFKDITPVLSDAADFREVIDAFVDALEGRTDRQGRRHRVARLPVRGAARLRSRRGLHDRAQAGKLPWETIREVYALEYGEAALELHIDAVGAGERVLVVDDVLATGGTADAVGRLVARQGAKLVSYSFLVELGFLRARSGSAASNVHALLSY